MLLHFFASIKHKPTVCAIVDSLHMVVHAIIMSISMIFSAKGYSASRASKRHGYRD
jgi:hypothetical protein